MAGFTLAHLSDPHLATELPAGAWPRLTLKQTLALSSWRRRRSRLHRMTALELLRDDVAKTDHCHVAVTGDLVNIADRAEFPPASDWLASLGSPDRVSVVSGNHDHTRRAPPGGGPALWEAFSRGDRGEGAPWLRVRDGIALVGLESGRPTPLGWAGGALGRRQIAEAAHLLRAAARRGLFRIVLIHHPPVPGPGGERKALRDRAGLRAMLAREGAELVLHGHHHITLHREIPGPHGPIAVIGVPSASALPERGDHHEPATWHLHSIEAEAGFWRLTTSSRRLDPRCGAFIDGERLGRRIARPGPAQ
ncbi:3',5'-cyclic AMP phosphodiesterase CpdA [Endobacter medicaginis]|uniref:3',5'-cyclic AMP phosphodiesterase CpdA n=3 Tax=Endobacter medicaginis TaxID=1181271 RepID=A0A839UV15_9PROT|nr:metallophosphoesterase [Endobacter medicaginis]MBB3174138.1 3',5'-cyclic AMP phosphodiesterase CpdA [Endobacter medicaginis]MCX5474182.1 metallophosphoesterase [Endobacter medicaginis]